MKLFSFILFLFFTYFTTKAQQPSIRFQHLTPEDGLSQGHVLCMLQDSEGFIWMGTYYGLNRYNGYTFTLFSKQKNNPKSVISDVIYSLFEDKDGFIWVGTVSGLDVFDKKTETFEHIPIGVNGLSDTYIRSIKQDRDGNIWVATNSGGLNRIEYNTRKILSFRSGKTDLISNTINDICIDKNNQLWIAAEGGGVSVMNTKNYHIKSIKTLITSFTKATSLFRDTNGIIWVGSSEGKLASINPFTFQCRLHNYLPNEFKNRSLIIKDIDEDINGNILIATIGAGLVLYNPKNEVSRIFLHSIYDSQTISSNEACSVMVDRSWTVFVGTYGRGVSKYSPYNLKFPVHYIQTKNDNEGDINAYTSCAQDYKGRLIIGTYSGFYVYNKNNWSYKRYLPGKTYAENKILSIAIAPDSSIWIGTNRGIHQYDKEFQKIGTYNIIDDNLDHQVYSIYFDHLNNMWFGVFVAEGLYKIPDSEWKNKKSKTFKYSVFKTDYNDSTTLFGDQIWSIKEDSHKNLWIGTNLGICSYNYQTNKFTRFNITNLCKTLEFDSQGNMWIATRGEGIFFFNPNTYSIKHYTTANGLSQNFVFGVIPVNNNEVWFTSENGLSRFNPVKEQFRNYDIYDGLPNNRFDDRSEKFLPNGEIYTGTAKGFTIFRPENIKDDTSKAKVVLSNLRISNNDIDYYSGKDNSKIPLYKVTEITLLPQQKDISLGFTALHYSAPHKIKYKYKLEGFDQQWIYTDARNRNARYTNLDGGKYTFYVMATNGDGIWNDVPMKITINVKPPFVKTTAFQAIIVIILGIGAFLLSRWRIASEQNKNITLAKMVKERTLEISDKNKLLENNSVILNQTNTLLELKQKDIESQKEELALQRDKLVELNATKDKLFSVIAHDLKNPFNVIIGFSDLILSNYYLYSDERRKKMTSQINQASRNAYQLLENLLEWSRSQKGNLNFNPTYTKIGHLIKTATFQVKEFALNKEINIKENIDESVANSTIMLDSNMMNTVLRNLLSNAIKFSYKNSNIFITASLIDSKSLKISVVDHGVGMNPDTFQNLFKLDKNVSSQGTAGEKGTGLGLFICKDFVETHRGKLWVESNLGAGTSFHIEIPLSKYGLE